MRHRSRANHRSLPEQRKIRHMTSAIDAALSICESGAGDEAIDLLGREATSPLDHSLNVLEAMPPTRFAASSGHEPQLFYRPAPAAGVGLAGRGAGTGQLGALHPDVNAVQRHYGAQQLSNFARSWLLGEMSDSLRPGEYEESARNRFDELLSRIQQCQLHSTVQNELHARQSGAALNFKDNWHIAPVSSARTRVDLDAWAQYIKDAPPRPEPAAPTLQVVSGIWAQRHANGRAG